MKISNFSNESDLIALQKHLSFIQFNHDEAMMFMEMIFGENHKDLMSMSKDAKNIEMASAYFSGMPNPEGNMLYRTTRSSYKKIFNVLEGVRIWAKGKGVMTMPEIIRGQKNEMAMAWNALQEKAPNVDSRMSEMPSKSKSFQEQIEVF